MTCTFFWFSYHDVACAATRQGGLGEAERRLRTRGRHMCLHNEHKSWPHFFPLHRSMSRQRSRKRRAWKSLLTGHNSRLCKHQTSIFFAWTFLIHANFQHCCHTKHCTCSGQWQLPEIFCQLADCLACGCIW